VSEHGDTIAAIATPRGSGGVGIIRVSGADISALLENLKLGTPVPRTASLRKIHDANGRLIDEVLVLYFPAPASFTGEDVLELQGHGGLVIMDMLLERVLTCGCRQARPGEFSERAFLNDKLDLVQAEAIADVIESHSRTAVRGAMRSLQGDFSLRVHSISDDLIHLRTHVEAYLDFPDEEIDTLPSEEFSTQCQSLERAISELLATARQGQMLRDGLHLVLAGKPNAGKSSLLNRLTAADTAIVSDIPGTTRDVIRERVHIDGIPIDVTDTAGLRDTADAIESEGVARARQELSRADRVLLVVDDADFSSDLLADLDDYLHAEVPVTVVRNKIDLTGRNSQIENIDGVDIVSMSTRTGDGLHRLTEHLKQVTGLATVPEGVFTARQRHLDALRRALVFVQQGRDLLDPPRPELLAEELRQAQTVLGEITGEFTSEDLLGEIFGSFCIGK
jgi:tRNA modification GTPase